MPDQYDPNSLVDVIKRICCARLDVWRAEIRLLAAQAEENEARKDFDHLPTGGDDSERQVLENQLNQIDDDGKKAVEEFKQSAAKHVENVIRKFEEAWDNIRQK